MAYGATVAHTGWSPYPVSCWHTHTHTHTHTWWRPRGPPFRIRPLYAARPPARRPLLAPPLASPLPLALSFKDSLKCALLAVALGLPTAGSPPLKRGASRWALRAGGEVRARVCVCGGGAGARVCVCVCVCAAEEQACAWRDDAMQPGQPRSPRSACPPHKRALTCLVAPWRPQGPPSQPVAAALGASHILSGPPYNQLV
jgi:hypothetical protein